MSLIYREKSARQRPVRHPKPYPRHHETRLRGTTPGTRVLSFSINQVEEPKYKPPRRFFSRPPVVHLDKAPQVPFIEAGGLDWTLPLLPEKTLPSRNEIKSLYLVSPPLSNELGESGDEDFPSSGPSASRSSSSYNTTQRQVVMSKQIRQSLWPTSTRSTSTRIYGSSSSVGTQNSPKSVLARGFTCPAKLKSCMKTSSRSNSTKSSQVSFSLSPAPNNSNKSWVPVSNHSFVRRKAAVKAEIATHYQHLNAVESKEGSNSAGDDDSGDDYCE